MNCDINIYFGLQSQLENDPPPPTPPYSRLLVSLVNKKKNQ